MGFLKMLIATANWTAIYDGLCGSALVCLLVIDPATPITFFVEEIRK